MNSPRHRISLAVAPVVAALLASAFSFNQAQASDVPASPQEESLTVHEQNQQANEKYDENPEVGIGVTYDNGRDRYPFTVIEVVNRSKLVVQQDNSKLISGSAQSETQEYEFERNPEHSNVVTITRRKDGSWRQVGKRASEGGVYFLGYRDKNLDPTF
jgi:hypothetical protein